MVSKVERLLMRVVDRGCWWKLNLLSRWRDVVGGMADHVWVERVDGGVLILGVEHPCWAQELSLMSDRLLERVREIVGGSRVKRVCFRVMDRVVRSERGECQLSVLGNSVGRVVGRVRLTGDEEAELALVRDDELRALMRSFYEGCKGRRDGEVDSVVPVGDGVG